MMFKAAHSKCQTANRFLLAWIFNMNASSLILRSCVLMQRDNLFYTALSYCMPATIMRFPYSFVEALVWTCITYFPVGMAANPGR